MGTHSIQEVARPSGGEEYCLGVAEEKDMEELRNLYYQVYGGKYTLPEVADSDKMKWAIKDSNYLWLIIRRLDEMVGAVLFVTDRHHRLGKSLAGVVQPEHRGNKIMKWAIGHGLDYILHREKLVDAVYGVVRTFVPQSFHDDLEDLGFVDVGVFPNVRKVSSFETHGLKVLIRPEALSARRQSPRLIPQSGDIYDIVRERLNLEPAEKISYHYHTPKNFIKYDLSVEKSPDIEWEYYKKRDSGELLMSFYPFHYPQIRLSTPDGGTQAYIHFEERDGHGDLMGLHTDQPENLTSILEAVSEVAVGMGIRYLEVLINAFDENMQMRAYEADFCPCAYFPAMEARDGQRVDFVVMCRNFVPLDFRKIRLTDKTRQFVRAYYKNRSAKLWEDLNYA